MYIAISMCRYFPHVVMAVDHTALEAENAVKEKLKAMNFSLDSGINVLRVEVGEAIEHEPDWAPPKDIQ